MLGSKNVVGTEEKKSHYPTKSILDAKCRHHCVNYRCKPVESTPLPCIKPEYTHAAACHPWPRNLHANYHAHMYHTRALLKQYHQSPNIRRTPSRTFCSYSSRLSRHIFAASTLAGLSSLGSASMLMTEMRIFSTDWMGDHRSDACS